MMCVDCGSTIDETLLSDSGHICPKCLGKPERVKSLNFMTLTKDGYKVEVQVMATSEEMAERFYTMFKSIALAAVDIDRELSSKD